MNLRLLIYELAATYRLDAPATRRLQQLAELEAEPVALSRWTWRAIAVSAAALGGFGVILWIAANWDALGRYGRFALLQGLFVVTSAGALWRPAARVPLGLLALLAIGGLFAYFGQTYQTGADPWQLFAWWAALALPLCLAARSDALWAPWTLVTMAAIGLWTDAHTGHRWRVTADDLSVHLLAWGAALVVVTALAPVSKRLTGAGPWSLRTAVTLLTIMVSLTAIGGLFHESVAPHYALGLLLLAVATLPFGSRRGFDVFAVSAFALGLNGLLVAGLARLLFENFRGSELAPLFFLGVTATGLLAASVGAILYLAKHYQTEGESS